MTDQSQPQNRMQFGLTALVGVVVTSAVLYLGYVWFDVAGIIAAMLALAVVFSYSPFFPVSDRWRDRRDILRVPAVLLMFGVVFIYLVDRGKEAARQSQCRINLKRIGQALQQYHADFGCFPPARINDESGTPMHSWRVLLLPYLECQSLYDAYDFSEPWNGPKNSRLASQWVQIFMCPDDYHWSKTRPETSYLVVVGDRTFWPGSESMTMQQVGGNASQKITVIEVADSGILWLEPKDLSIDQMDFQINGSTRPGIRSRHRGGANVLFADGTVRFLERREQSKLKNLLRIDRNPKSQPLPDAR